MTLRLKLDYAICEKLCVPAEGRSELTLTSGRASQDAALTAAEGRVPKQVAWARARELVDPLGAASNAAPGNSAHVVVDVAAPAGVDLFAEGPTPQWALPVPTPIDRRTGRTAALRLRARRRAHRRELRRARLSR